MTDEMVNDAPEQEAVQEPQVIKPEDIKTFGDLRALQMQNENGLIEWAKKKIAETNYVQAVQTELAMHKGDTHSFIIRCLINLAEKQEARIDTLETLLAKAIGTNKKGK